MSEKPPVDRAASPVSSEDELPREPSGASTAPKQPTVETADETPPAQPPRPVSPQTQNQNTLQEAFPTIDATVVRAVLVASGGQLEPAFNALLSMSDPSAVETPPPQPPRPQQPQRSTRDSLEFATSTPQSQLEADAQYAKQLQEHLVGTAQRRQQQHRESHQQQRPPAAQQPRRRLDANDDEYYYDSDKDHSFFEEDLPVIKANIKKGFLETQNKFNSWITDIKKKIDGDSPETSPPGSARNSGQYARTGNRRQQGYEGQRRSRDGYDADPAVLSDDFTHLGLKDGSSTPPTQRRQKANPNLFQPSPKAPGGRSVSFDERPTNIDDDDLYRPGKDAGRASAGHSPARGPSPVGGSKWEPLKSVQPEPMDRDPFSLGDSDDEKDGLIKESEPPKTASVTSPQETGVTKT